MANPAEIVEHYGTDDLTARVSEALARAGLDAPTLSWQALAPLDQFHVRGAQATAELAACLSLTPATRVIDVGCGLGGPARHLASVYGCAVVGIDLNARYVALADMLTERAGLSSLVRHVEGDALALAFGAASFDVAWTQHVAMNIADRDAFYAGIAHVLVPGGRLAIYDVIAGNGEPPHFPVPWARTPEHSHLVSEAAMRSALHRAGFAVDSWTDVTAEAVAWFAAQARARADGAAAPPHNLALVMGPEFPSMTANLGRNLGEGRVRLAQVVAVLRRDAPSLA